MTEENSKKAPENEENDIVVEADESLDDSVLSEDRAIETVKKLKEKIKVLEKEKQEYLDGWQRAKADYVNSQKEEAKNRIELIKFATADLISELIPALDAFDMAMGNKEAWEKVDKNWRSGVEYIYNQIVGTLGKSGLFQDNPVGQIFDIMKHHSIGTVRTEKEEEKGTIAEVMQKGYFLNGKEIRPASVKVFE